MREIAMAHWSDNLEMTFTHRGSWKGHIKSRGQIIDTVPVSWTKGWVVDKDTKSIYLEVWFQKEDELLAAMNAAEPFKVAVGIANDYDAFPHSFSEYRGLFLVQPTGERLSDISIQTKVLERIKG
ncbi:hypothetical protein [Methylobacterium sp. J-070]|uniref:hypothetical protein n=1 Tax=Methylobacterium sp. J-070 TaxID=2836650 RepID=UPI001FBBAFBD|nr:hypothetical protein [Methylobacterium sp. J-070]MCJ2048528.1 hypothetical protein [Methylobacterium sp. J-070]